MSIESPGGWILLALALTRTGQPRPMELAEAAALVGDGAAARVAGFKPARLALMVAAGWLALAAAGRLLGGA